jgi:hypothetical protein
MAPAEAVTLGDGFPLAAHLRAQSERQLAGVFGPAFAAAVMATAPGAWAGPIASAHGLHLVWVEAVLPGQEAPLDAVRAQLTLAVRRERAAARIGALVDRLRRETVVRVEGPAGAGT